jgi:hypothetical protein
MQFADVPDARVFAVQLLVWNVDSLSKGLCLPMQAKGGHKDKVIHCPPDLEPRTICPRHTLRTLIYPVSHVLYPEP